MARWSPRMRIPIIPGFLVLNLGRRGASTSLKVGPMTFNSRGGWSFNGPSILDFRGRWKDPTRKSPTRPTRPTPTRRPVTGVGSLCGAAKWGTSPCGLAPHDGGWHLPTGGEDPWRETWAR